MEDIHTPEAARAIRDAEVKVRDAVAALSLAARVVQGDADAVDSPTAVQLSAVGASLALSMNAATLAIRIQRGEVHR